MADSGKTNKDKFTAIFKDGMRETQKSTRELLKTDPEVRALAQAIKDNGFKDPKDKKTAQLISQFVAEVERKTERLSKDMPNWSGNDFFDHGHGSPLVKTDRFAQLGCIGEAAHAASMVMTLREEGFLPAATEWDYVSKGDHWAPTFFRTDMANPPDFIMDTWLVSPGQAAPVFESDEAWRRAVNEVGAFDHRQSAELMTAFEATTPGLRTMQGQRKYDMGYLGQWMDKHPGESLGIGYDGDKFEAAQDMIVARYYLGEAPVIGADQMPQRFFESLRDRLAHVAEKDKDSNALKMAGVSAEKILSAKSFAELKPQAEAFYAAYGLDRKVVFDKKATPEQVEKTIRGSGDINRDGTINYAEAQLLKEMLAPMLKETPDALKVLAAAEWKDKGVDDVVKQVRTAMVPPSGRGK